MFENNGNTQIARQYREKYGWDMPTAKLARIMYEENKLEFTSLETARSRLRYIEGKTGSKIKSIPKQDSRPFNPYKIPESSKQEREPFILPKLNNNILLISDLHIPYHDIESITIAFDYGVEHKVNTIFINGDLLDFHHLSRFQKDPRKRSIKHEFDTCKEFLRVLRSTFPEAQIYWLKGNHDMRYEHWLMSKAYEVFDDEYYHMEQRLRLNEENVHIIDLCH